MIHKNLEEVLEPSALMAKVQNFGRPNQKGNSKRRENEKREDRYYDHYKIQGHTKENCFKINGYYEGYVELMKNKKEKKVGKQVNMAKSTNNRSG